MPIEIAIRLYSCNQTTCLLSELDFMPQLIGLQGCNRDDPRWIGKLCRNNETSSFAGLAACNASIIYQNTGTLSISLLSEVSTDIRVEANRH